MRQLRPGGVYLEGLKGALALLLCLVVSACSLGGQSEPPALSGIPSAPSGMQSGSPILNDTPPAEGTLLPGQQIWKQGASSFLFGTNDTQEWSDNNVETNPAIQQALKDAHFTLMRTFFFDKSLADGHATTDAEIEQRIKTIENSGMVCLGVLVNIMNVAFAEHVVRYLGSRCNLYEFGNESDYYGVTVEDYLKQWNTVIPLLRQINPQAKFIGPATYNDYGNQCHYDPGYTHCFMQDFLTGVKASHVLPDAISFHWYPCYNDSEASCLARASTYAEVTAEVKWWVKSILGKDLPVGITEWNYDPSVPPPKYSSTFIQQFSITALRSMIQAKLDFANQFDALSYSGYGAQDMFDLEQQGQPKAQYYAIKTIISEYRP
ncbi:MAG TPA: hypothetical protein VFV38_49505 [Ktedonobacteraceae bacterium]|nr:hypothetical protein [Ktedonobacteraceae bacterium]